MALNVSINQTVKKDAGPALRKAQKKRLMDGADVGFAKSQELVPQDRGTLLQSGFQPTETSDGAIQYGYRANHAGPMEFGTDPFQPPVEPLLEWSERVTGDKGLGYYVALQKIPEEGIDPQPYLRPGAEKQKQFYKANPLSQYLDREL